MLLVRSYRTLAPLPVDLTEAKSPIGGMFLWHYPHGYPHWELPSKSGLSGARTFLRLSPQAAQPATTRPTFPYLAYLKGHIPMEE